MNNMNCSSMFVVVTSEVFVFRDVPANAALPVIRPALGRQHSMSDRAKVAMQQYLNHFLGNMDIVNSREVCLAFSPRLHQCYFFFFNIIFAYLLIN